MNSKELQKKFSSVYSDFFSRCTMAVSAPHSFLWSGDFSGFYGGLTTSSKIPVRFYIGLEESSSPDLEIPDSFLAYFPDAGKFKPVQISLELKSSLESVLLGKMAGAKLHFLSEIPLGASLGSLGAISACLAMLAKALKNRRTEEQKNDKELFLKAWGIAKKLQTGRTLGATAYAALSESSYPIVFYSEGSKYWAKPLDEIAKLPANPVWPVDFGLIFSGKLVQGAAVIASAEEVKRISEEREAKLNFKKIIKNHFWQDYINFLKQITNQNLYALTDLFQKGAHEDTLKYFFNTLNQYQNLLHFLEISNPEIDRIYGRIHDISNASENRVGSGVKITGVGKGGMVLFALPYGQYRSQIEKEFGKMLVYASWRDGTGAQATTIDQNISQAKYSQFIDKNSYVLTAYSGDEVKKMIVSESKLKKCDMDLIVDSYNKKIIVPGKEISSKNLPSQKSSAIILCKLLNTKDMTLKNSDLPGSYASSRFDLQSKITSQISKLAGIDFEISGSIYDNYTLKVKKITGKIGVLEKI